MTLKNIEKYLLFHLDLGHGVEGCSDPDTAGYQACLQNERAKEELLALGWTRGKGVDDWIHPDGRAFEFTIAVLTQAGWSMEDLQARQRAGLHANQCPMGISEDGLIAWHGEQMRRGRDLLSEPLSGGQR